MGFIVDKIALGKVSIRVLRLSPSQSHSIHSTTSLKVAGSIPDGVIGIFH